MLIPYVSSNPQICARSLCDQHLRKLIVETAQILSTTARKYNDFCDLKVLNKGLMKSTHINHPYNRWAWSDLSSLGNYRWLFILFSEMLYEYRFRFGKQHKCEKYVERLLYLWHPHIEYTEPPKPKSVEHIHQTTKAFRQYMCDKAKTWATRTDKKQMKMIFTKRRPPNWMSSVSKYIEVK